MTEREAMRRVQTYAAGNIAGEAAQAMSTMLLAQQQQIDGLRMRLQAQAVLLTGIMQEREEQS